MNLNFDTHTISMNQKYRAAEADRKAQYNLIIEAYKRRPSTALRTVALKILSLSSLITAALIFFTVS